MDNNKKIEQKLKESEDMFRAITGSTQDAIIMIDNDGNISYWNKAAEKMFGYSGNEIIGKNLHSVLTPKKYHDAQKKGFNKFKDTGNGAAIGKTLELSALKKDGTQFPIELSLSSIKIGEKWVATGIIRDITERKRVEELIKESEKQYKSIFDNVNEGLVLLDVRGKILNANPRALEIMGAEPEEIIGKNLIKLLTVFKLSKRMVIAALKSILGGTRKGMREWTITNKQGKEITILGYHSLIKEGNKIKTIVMVFTDISDQKRIEEELKSSEEKFRMIFENVNDEIIYLDKFGKILDINKRVIDIFGYKPEEVIGKHFSKLNFFELKHLPRLIKLFADSIKGRPLSMMELEAKRRDGKTIFIESSTSLIKKNGKVDSVLAIVRDITARKKIEEKIKNNNEKLKEQQETLLKALSNIKLEKERVGHEKDKVNTILQSIGDGVLVIDANYQITIFNQIAVDISGFSLKEVLGKRYDKVLKFVNEKDNKINYEFIEKAMATGAVQEMLNHTVLIRKDGTKIAVADSAAPLKDGDNNIVGCVIVFRDVTKEREIDRMKTEFVSVASHQLRTPLTSISWFVEMLLNEDVGKISKEQKDYLEQVYDSNKRMIRLVNDLLNVSRIETGKMMIVPESIQLEDLIESVLIEVQSIANSKNINVIFKKPKPKLAKIKLDSILMRQVVQNLLSNAVRYNKKNGNVEISIKKEKEDLLFAIVDTGVGIPKNQQKHMFTKFFRADNAAKIETEGTGLGLYIVKSIIETSGGRIWFKSQENKGTTFFITIPLAGMKEKKGTRKLVAT